MTNIINFKTTAMFKEAEDMNDDIAAWNKSNLQDLKDRLKQLNVQHDKRSPNKTALARVLRGQLRQRFGLVNRISYTMPRSAIFLHKGVGRGRPISKPKGAKEWYGPVIEKNIDKLGDIVAEGGGNMIISNLSIR